MQWSVTRENTGAVTEEPTEESTETEPAVTEEKPKKDSKTGLMVLLLFGTIAGIGGFMYLKNAKKKPAKTVGPDPDADYVMMKKIILQGFPKMMNSRMKRSLRISRKRKQKRSNNTCLENPDIENTIYNYL